MSRIFSLLGFFIFGVIGIFAYFADGAHRGLFGSVEKFATDAPLFLLIMALLG